MIKAIGVFASHASLCSKCKADETSSMYIRTIVPKTLCAKIISNKNKIAFLNFVPVVFLNNFPVVLIINASCICANTIAKNKCTEMLTCARFNFTTIAPNKPVKITPIKNAMERLNAGLFKFRLKNKINF